jgi:hypothetical protein
MECWMLLQFNKSESIMYVVEIDCCMHASLPTKLLVGCFQQQLASYKLTTADNRLSTRSWRKTEISSENKYIHVCNYWKCHTCMPFFSCNISNTCLTLLLIVLWPVSNGGNTLLKSICNSWFTCNEYVFTERRYYKYVRLKQMTEKVYQNTSLRRSIHY